MKNNLSDAFKIAHPTIFLSKKVAKKFKYNDNYYISADLDFILKLIRNNVTYKHLNFFSIAMEYYGMSSSLNYFFLKLREDFQIQKKYFKDYKSNFLKQKIRKIKSVSFFSRKELSKVVSKNFSKIQIR